MMYINKTLSQNSDESITKDGVYDLTRFSKHESDIVQIVLNNVMEDYPRKLRSIGLCNEAHGILYKPRYVLFETIVQVFGDSQYYVDLFAVALAYAEKGSGYREKAIRYFEEAEPYLTEDFLNTFLCCQPLSVYTKFSKIYESEHKYKKAIELNRLSRIYSPESNYLIERELILQKKLEDNKPKRVRKPNSHDLEFETNVEKAARYFVKKTEFHK